MAEQTINPLPTAGSTFLEVLTDFLQNEDADRFDLQFNGYVEAGGIHGLVAGLTGTPSALTAFPGGFYITETGSITYADASTTFVIAHRDTTGNLTGYTRVAGTHYLIAVGAVAPALPADCVRLMTVTTAGGSVTGVTDTRQLSPLVNRTTNPYVRLIGTEASASDFRIAEDAGDLLLQENTGTEDAPVWATRFRWRPSNFALTLIAGNTQARSLTLPDKDDTLATLTDISASSFAPGTRLIFDNDTAPVGWVRDVVLNDRVPMIVSGARADGGSWTVSGLTVASHTHTLSAHKHESPTAASDGVTLGYNVKTGAWVHGASPNTYTMDRGGAIDAEAVQGALYTSPPDTDLTGAAAPAISSDATWRPLHRDVIIAEKS